MLFAIMGVGKWEYAGVASLIPASEGGENGKNEKQEFGIRKYKKHILLLRVW